MVSLSRLIEDNTPANFGPRKTPVRVPTCRLPSLVIRVIEESRRESFCCMRMVKMAQRVSTGGQNGPIPFSPVSDSFIYKLGMYRILYKSGMSQFQPLQFSMSGGGGRGRERDQRYAGAGGDLRPVPLGRGASLDRVRSGCLAGERAPLRRAWRGVGCSVRGRDALQV